MKSIICFKKGDYDNCRFWYDKAMEAHGAIGVSLLVALAVAVVMIILHGEAL